MSVCRFAGGDRFVFQNTPDLSWPANAPAARSDGTFSILPVPWLVRVQVSDVTPGVLQESDASGDPWSGSVRLSQLAPRGARLLASRAGPFTPY